MITRGVLSQYRNVVGFNLGQLEKDYLQHLLLSIIYRSTANALVFKGGTCLQKVYGLNRFSEDLDFTIYEPPIPSVDVISASISDFGYPTHGRLSEKEDSVQMRFEVRGPLYMGESSLCYLRIEASGRERVVLEPEFKMVYPIYEDLPPYSTLSICTEELLAEKIRALITRGRARDLYDVHFLLKKETPIKWDLIEKKMAYYGRGIKPEDVISGVKSREKGWERELSALIPRVPPFGDVEKFVVARVMGD